MNFLYTYQRIRLVHIDKVSLLSFIDNANLSPGGVSYMFSSSISSAGVPQPTKPIHASARMSVAVAPLHEHRNTRAASALDAGGPSPVQD